MKSVLLLATMDTKGAEALYLHGELKALGSESLSMDLSTRCGKPVFKADITASEVARAGGRSLKALNGSGNMASNMETMIVGASRIASRLMAERKIEGITGIGGYTGTSMIAAVMQALPFGFPKLMVSSVAAMRGLSGFFPKTSDIILFNSVVEIAGLSNPVRSVLERAAYAVRAMPCRRVADTWAGAGNALAMTTMSPCERCASFVRSALEKAGCEVVGFHANGAGDRAMEEMIASGMFRGVIDLATGGVGENLYGFARDAGPGRLESAGARGIPQIVSTCSVNHVTPSRSRRMLYGRPRYELDKLRVWLRASPEELRRIAEAFALKLNRSKGPVRVLVPMRGWSSVDKPGGPTYDPEGDAVFCKTLRKKLRKEIEIVEVDANLEDARFAQAVVEAASAFFGTGRL